MMKVLISHKKEDSLYAESACNKLKNLGVDAYLDLLEGNLSLEGKELTEHIKENLNSCTDILVVMSKKTKDSWWVPFEIGMAAQKDFPIVNYLINNIDLPEYLEYWPSLKQESDLKKYVEIKKETEKDFILENKGFFNLNKKSKTEQFYDNLRKSL